MQKTNKPLIRAFYSIPELARMINYSSQGARKLFFKMNIPITLLGSRYIIFLTDLQSFAPSLYNSILEAQNLNSMISPKVERDNEAAIKEQFTNNK